MRTLAERLWAKVDRRGPEDCWEWQGYRRARGHGQIGRGRREEGLTGAHRAAWEVTFGPIPDGLFVCHRCDNPPCCNPAHLFLGTAADNARDMADKGRGRGAEGLASPFAKLMPEQVAEIRRRFVPYGHPAHRKGNTATELAREFGITPQYVRDLAHGKWRRNG